MTQPPVRRTKTAVEYLFMGEVGNGLHIHGTSSFDLGERISFSIHTNPLAPFGVSRESLFRNLYVQVEAVTAGVLNVTPIVDGAEQETIQVRVNGNNPEREVFEIPVTQPFPVAATERTRAGVRGTWIQVWLYGQDEEGNDWDISIEGVEVEAIPYRDTVRHRSYSPAALKQVTRTALDVLYLGDEGPGIWSMDTGFPAGAQVCLSGSSTGLCKIQEGLLVGLDYRVGGDRFQAGDVTTQTPGWIALQGTLPTDDPVNGWLDCRPIIGVYYDPLLPETDEQLVFAEVYHSDPRAVLPGAALLLDADAGDVFHYFVRQQWIFTPTTNRMAMGKRNSGGDSSNVPVVGGNEDNFWWISALTVPKPGTSENFYYGGIADTSWGVSQVQQKDAEFFGRLGRPGIRYWDQAGLGGASARLRTWRWHRNARIEIRNIPTAHQVVIERDADEIDQFGASSETVQNVSGSTADIVFDCEGFPTPAVNKRIPPMSRIYVTTVGDPSTKLAELEEDVNWGSIYVYQGGTAVTDLPTISYVLEPNEIAPAGPSGDALFHTLWLVVTRNNQTDVDCVVTPILDDVELATQTVTFVGLNSANPVTEVCEIPLHEPFPDALAERFRNGLRGSWFRFRLESGTYIDDGSRLIFEGAEVAVQVLRESKQAESTVVGSPTTLPPAFNVLLEDGFVLLLEDGGALLQES